MLPSSVRRVVCAAPASGIASSLAAAASASASTPKTAAASAAASAFSRGHQRRFSSSKPSRSDNGASDISAGQSVTASSSSSSSSSASGRGDGKASNGDKRKRKSKDAADREASAKKLPSVPSTHHMSQEALGLSSFFSLHRPISITQTMPRSVTEEHFASIFNGRSKSGKMSDAMATLSDTIDQLEAPMASVTISGQQDSQDMGDGMHRFEVRNADGTESSIHLQVDTMSGEFLPFRPPPLPVEQSASTVQGAEAAEADAVDESAQHRIYNAMFTIEESTEPNGQVRIVAHSPRIMQDEQPRSFLERMAQRQLKLDDARGRRDMHAISVKRQRKLKMKKKKYKKLMKRTRNLRRKLDRT